MKISHLPAVLIISILNLSADEAYWPGWLGPERNGMVENFKAPEKWPAKLNKKWQVEVGDGYTTPIIKGNRIYLHSRQGGNEVLRCINAKDGTVIWQQDFKRLFQIGGGGEKHGAGPKANPYLADGRIFTLSINGTFSAWDAESGKMLWQSDYVKKFKKPHAYWGACSSPIVEGDKVFVRLGSCEEGELVGFNVQTGKVIWALGPDGTCYSSPLIVKIEGLRQLADWNHNELIGVDMESGKKLWSYPMPHLTHDQNMPTPSFYKGRFYLGAENRGIRCLEPVLEDGKWTVKELWKNRRLALNMSTAVVNNNLLFGFNQYKRGQLFCQSLEDGTEHWRGPSGMGQNATFLSVEGYVITLLGNANLHIFKAEKTSLNIVASYKVSESSTWSAPVLLKDGFLIKDRNCLIRYTF